MRQIEFEGKKAWHKPLPPSKHSVWHIVQGILAKLFRFDLLKPTVQQGGYATLKAEAERLQHWEQLGLPVVNVLELSEQGLVTQDAGKTVSSLFGQVSVDQADLCQRSLAALIQVHAQGQVHGMPRLRNAVIDEQNILRWLDLEEDPLAVMSFSQAKARDLFFLLWDLNKVPEVDIQAIKAQYFQACPDPDSEACLEQFAKQYQRWILPWARHLEGWGKDLKQVNELVKRI